MKKTLVKLRGQAMQIMRPELDEIRQEMQDEGMSPAAASEGQERMNMIENMTTKVPSFKTGGASWFLDLTTTDSFYILPIFNALTFWLLVEVNITKEKVYSAEFKHIEKLGKQYKHED